jgi:RNA polymerase sigma factor (sigma-70 family)
LLSPVRGRPDERTFFLRKVEAARTSTDFFFVPVMAPVLERREQGMDAALLRMVRGGDAKAFEAVVRAFAPRVRRMAMHYFRSPFDQEDATQEVFLLLHRQRESVDPLRAAEFPGFVLTLARRRMVDLLRARGHQPPPEPLEDEHWVDDAEAPAQRAADAQLAELIQRFESKLKPAYRAFFRAVFVEGKDFDEARGALGLGQLRARYLKMVLLRALRRHAPLLEYLGKRGTS